MSEQWTTDELLNAIGAAMKARDMPAVAMLMRRLAVQSPDDADAIMAVLELAGNR